MADSNHWEQHKMADINFLINKIIILSLNKARLEKELHGSLKEVQYKHYVRNFTTLAPMENRDKKFVKLPVHGILKGLGHFFKSRMRTNLFYFVKHVEKPFRTP